jgi:hypothetical protein
VAEFENIGVLLGHNIASTEEQLSAIDVKLNTPKFCHSNWGINFVLLVARLGLFEVGWETISSAQWKIELECGRFS